MSFSLEEVRAELEAAYLESALSTAKLLRRHADDPRVARMSGPEALRVEADCIEEAAKSHGGGRS